ncbi:type II toxin-antitoxin system Phd/YefM family antitoxin [Nocardiopsis sp. N85]|uniref:type II toxin-antitoxin system Phd/YefM family antitoxin n=1 Tax=Nocardiopsis sp. N85 TaxID=3029400 RepID=UPI00237FC60A|nr:type II toxin-antitoxin system Phd/YefM family antitoxin [Nocardiopsis sp. N85]MDE3724680.1 type II toxin-antitoxin system Phd/YefM family antitoxin [Nocardiopsis sp. N85]
MREPVTETVTEVRRHLAAAIDRACRDRTPTLITRRGGCVAVLIDADGYRRLPAVEEAAEDARLHRLADEAGRRGTRTVHPLGGDGPWTRRGVWGAGPRARQPLTAPMMTPLVKCFCTSG